MLNILKTYKDKFFNLANRFNLFNNFVSAFTILILVMVSFSAGGMYADLTRGDYVPANGANQAANVKKVAGNIENLVKPNEKDTIRGNRNAEIALIEYSDIDCPFCKQFHSTALQVLDEYKDKVMWVHRDFPIDSLHPEASKKAQASACVYSIAGNDTYWKYIDALYERNETAKDLSTIAVEFGVNKAKFDDCFTNNKEAAAVKADYDEGVKAGVQGTPGNFIMNIKTGKALELRGAVPFEEVKTSIESVK